MIKIKEAVEFVKTNKKVVFRNALIAVGGALGLAVVAKLAMGRKVESEYTDVSLTNDESEESESSVQ